MWDLACAGATVPKEKAFFILGPHVAEGFGARVIVLLAGLASWKIGERMLVRCLCDAFWGSYFVSVDSYHPNSGREFRW